LKKQERKNEGNKINKAKVFITGVCVLLMGLALVQAEDQAAEKWQRSLSHNFTRLYWAGEQEEALKVGEMVLEFAEKNFDSDSLDTVRILNNLAALYCDQGKLDKTVLLLERADEIYQARGEFDRPGVAMSLYGLAIVFRGTSNHEEIRLILKRALEISTETDGSEHPNTKLIKNNLENLAGTTEQKGDCLHEPEADCDCCR
jgi:tetratricopeptide (TPR) repeat protein